MLHLSRRRLATSVLRQSRIQPVRSYAESSKSDTKLEVPAPTSQVTQSKATTANSSQSNELATSSHGAQDAAVQESVAEGEKMRTMQAPNRQTTWSRSQQPRAKAMVGPRFEQTIIADQPRPLAAIELIHKQPVRWRHERVVSCDGGGGPLGHPRIFINLDKPQINFCTYCGLPYANEHHREHLESLPHTSYPLEPTGHPAEVAESQRVSDEPLGFR